MSCLEMARRCALMPLLAACAHHAPSPASDPDVYLFSYFTRNGEDGVHLATSDDGVHWSAQTRVPVMAHEPEALNAWAPDLFYDDAAGEFAIVWATAIPGRFPATDTTAQRTSRGRADHRLYYVTTRDFRTFSPAKLLYDGGFTAIDGTIAKRGDRYYLVMKDETFFPSARTIRVASSAHATGPYGPASPPITDKDTEGPSVLRSGDWWYVYFDYYTRGRYGAVRTRDFARWEPFSDSLETPRGIRHGSAFLAPRSVLRGLLALDSAGTR